MSRRKIQNLETTSSLIGIDAEAQIKQLNDDILAKKATLQALTVTRDRAEYDRDIDYALVHLKKVAAPDMEFFHQQLLFVVFHQSEWHSFFHNLVK